MWAFLVYCQLYICKINNMQFYFSRIPSHFFCKIYYLLFCSLTCIWRSMEICRLKYNTSFCDHISCYRTVYTTWQKKHCLSCCAKRHSSRPCDLLWINIYHRSYFDIDKYLRIVYVYLRLWKSFKDFFTNSRIYLHGSHRIVFTCPSGVYFERKVFIFIYVIDMCYNILSKLIKTFVLMLFNRTYPNYAKHSRKCCDSLVIIIFTICAYIYTSAFFVDFKIPINIF